MLPSQLNAKSFEAYPPQARRFAIEHIDVLRQLPLAFAPSFLREAAAYDWKMPAEQRKIASEIGFLSGLPKEQLAAQMREFAALRLNEELTASDWVNSPSGFLEQLSAWLWSTHQMDAFHAAADAYTSTLARTAPAPAPATPRLAIVVVGQNVEKTGYPLFRKLRPSGTYFTRVKPDNGLEQIISLAASRARTEPNKAVSASFAHWYIEGGSHSTSPDLHRDLHSGLTKISYDGLAPARAALLDRTQQTITSGSSGPEALRTLLARLKPEDVGLAGPDAVLNHFQLSLLTEGSGTQIFSTTFVQWAARECLRRAEPKTLVVRYAPRQQMQTMNAMLSRAPVQGVDAEGSLVDADMGAYYTWINLQRLSGSSEARFLAWFEGQSQAVAIGPELPRGSVSDSAISIEALLGLLS